MALKELDTTNQEIGTNPYSMDRYENDESPYTEGEPLPKSVSESYIDEKIETRLPTIRTMSLMNGRQLADMADYFNSEVTGRDIKDAMQIDSGISSEDIAYEIAGSAVLGSDE